MKDTVKLSNQVWQYAIFLPSGVVMSATTCFCYPKYFSKKVKWICILRLRDLQNFVKLVKTRRLSELSEMVKPIKPDIV